MQIINDAIIKYSQTSFRVENSGGFAKFRLFSQAIQTPHKTGKMRNPENET